jgi:hypothetical protein
LRRYFLEKSFTRLAHVRPGNWWYSTNAKIADFDQYKHLAILSEEIRKHAEPLPMRIASLALGTGELDCVYHFALYELQEAVQRVGNEDQGEMLATLLDGRRLRDISDLPLDLAI